MSIHQPIPHHPHSPLNTTLINSTPQSLEDPSDSRSDHTGHTDQDCIIVDTEPLSITEDGIKRKLSMPNISRRQSTGKTTLRKRPSISPSFSSFLTPTKLRLPRRLSAQSPQITALSPASRPISGLPDTAEPISPTMAKPKLPAIEAITNWLAVKPTLPAQIDRPASEPAPVPEPIPAMLRYPPRDPHEIPHSPDCIDCAHKVAIKEGFPLPSGDEDWIEERLNVEIGNSVQSLGQEEDKIGSTFGSYQSLASAADVDQTPTRPNLSISTSVSPRRALVSRESSGLDLAALPEHEEAMVFNSPDMSPIDDLAEPPTSLALTRSISEGPHVACQPAKHRVWLCSPPPRSPISPMALDSTTMLSISATPVTMTRSKSEATVTTLAVSKPPSTFAGRAGQAMRRRPFVTRSVSTGRLATEFDDQGRVVCMSAHSDRVLANKITSEKCWRRPIASVPPTPTSPTQASSAFGSVAKGRGFARGSLGASVGRVGLPIPRRANSVQQDIPSEFGEVQSRRSSLDGERSRYEGRRRSVPTTGFGSFRAKGWLGTGPSVKV